MIRKERKGYKTQAMCISKFMQISLNGSCDFLLHPSNNKKNEMENGQQFVLLLTRSLLSGGYSFCLKLLSCVVLSLA